MAQYKTGTVNVTNGSDAVVGVGTLWLTNISIGDWFVRKGDDVSYQVKAVPNDLSLTLDSNYAGTSANGVSYSVTTDFTANFNIPLLARGDIDTATIFARAMAEIDKLLGLNTGEWIDLSDTPTFVDADTFTLVGDKTADYQVDRRIRMTDATVLYGTITASSFAAGITTIDVLLDSGSLSASLSAVAVGIASVTNPAISGSAIRGGTPKVDAIDEYTADAGVTIDGLLIKDGGFVTLDIGNINIAGNTISSTDVDGAIILTPNGVGRVGIGLAPDLGRLLHIKINDVGAISVTASPQTVIIEESNTGGMGITLIGRADRAIQLSFRAPGSNIGGNINYVDTDTQFTFQTLAVGGIIDFYADDGVHVLNMNVPALGVNFWEMAGSIAGSALTLTAAGTDADIDLELVPKGAGAVVIPIGTDAAPSLVFNGSLSGTGMRSVVGTNRVAYVTNGNIKFEFSGNELRALNSSGGSLINETGSATNPTLLPRRSNFNTGVGSAASNQLSLIADSIEIIRANTIASGVNFLDATAAAAASGPTLAAAGADTNIDLNLNSKGTGDVLINGVVVAGVAAVWKKTCRVATTGNITLSGEQTIDDVATSADRVLAKDQTAGAENGIYVSAAGAWARATDADADAEMISGVAVHVSEGTANADSLWFLTTDDPIVVGTTSLTFTEFVGGGGGGDTHPIVDTTAIIKGSADDTKLMRFEVDGIATGTTRVITMADQNVDLTPGVTFQTQDAQLDDIAGLAVTKGGIIMPDGTNWQALGIGADNEILTADAAETLGAKWAAIVQGVGDKGARVTHSAAQSIPNNAVTALAFDTERFDTDTIHDNVTNNERLTPNTAGKYVITGHIVWASNATGERLISIRLNGATFIAATQFDAAAAVLTDQSIATIYDFNGTTDYAELAVLQKSGANLDITKNANFSPEFSMQLLA